ncbi:hypothetical protein RHECNPAF_1260088 [Rhizobium etli CNPAF512]|nr:hypothetical protein RHECNPAF_1260088 [Rhizobium etli CNPAF512]
MRTAQLQEMHQEKRRLCACSVDPILMRALSMGDLGGAIMVLWQAGGKWNGLRRRETVRNDGREAMKPIGTDRRVFWAARSNV